MLVITIKQGKEKSLLVRQPWIYASAIERIDGKPGAGPLQHEGVSVCTVSGMFR